jgi:hypothetical protein
MDITDSSQTKGKAEVVDSRRKNVVKIENIVLTKRPV